MVVISPCRTVVNSSSASPAACACLRSSSRGANMCSSAFCLHCEQFSQGRTQVSDATREISMCSLPSDYKVGSEQGRSRTADESCHGRI